MQVEFQPPPRPSTSAHPTGMNRAQRRAHMARLRPEKARIDRFASEAWATIRLGRWLVMVAEEWMARPSSPPFSPVDAHVAVEGR